MRFLECPQISWEGSPLPGISLVNDDEVISHSSADGLRILRFCVMSGGKMKREPTSNTHCEEKLTWFKSSSQYRTLDTIDGEPMEFEWNISQDSLHWSLSVKVPKVHGQKWAHLNNSKDELSSYRCSMTSYGEKKDNETECIC